MLHLTPLGLSRRRAMNIAILLLLLVVYLKSLQQLRQPTYSETDRSVTDLKRRGFN